MPLEVTATCALCGVARQSANHWFLGRGAKGVRRRLAILSYTLAEAQAGGDILCGEGCLHKWLTQNLEMLVTKD
jgi:hypothetical protein